MGQHPLNLVEIVDSIADHLSRKDQVNCLRVSKTFHAVLIPRVWRTVAFLYQSWKPPNKQPKYPSIDSLELHKYHVQELEFNGVFPDEYFTLQGYQRLQRLKIHIPMASLKSSQDKVTPLLDRILQKFSGLISAHSSTLEHIFVCLNGVHITSPPRELWEGIAQCSHLRKLLLGYMVVPQELLSVFLKALEKPNALSLIRMALPEWPASLNGDDVGGSADYSTTSLGDDSNRSQFVLSGPRNITMAGLTDGGPYGRLSYVGQAMMLRCCPNLESLHWRGGSDTDARNVITEALQPVSETKAGLFCGALSKSPWNMLRFESLEMTWIWMNDKDLANLLQKMLRLKKLIVSATNFGTLSFQSLFMDRALKLGGMSGQQRRRLCDTVEQLELDQCREVTSSMVQTLLESCPNLRVFKADKIAAKDISQGREWACQKLTHLYIYVEATEEGEGDRHHALSVRDLEMQNMAFAQLGKLTSLNALSLTTSNTTSSGLEDETRRTLDLRLESGLRHLAPLKRLRELWFMYDKCQRQSPEEAYWMLENWPKLSIIKGSPNSDTETCHIIRDILRSKRIQLHK